MSFLAQEQGVETAAPVELYEINYGAQTWYLVSGDAPYTDPLTLRLYEPYEMARSEIDANNDFGKSGITVQVRRDAPFLDLFRVAPPSGVVSLTIKRVHRTDTADQIVVIWKGRMLNVAWAPAIATVTCESIRASVQRYGLRRPFQLSCPHVLYGSACGVSRATHEIVGTASSINGEDIIVTDAVGYDDDNFAGGYMEWQNSLVAAVERRSIRASLESTGQLSLIGVTVGLTVGDEVRLYPGCDHTLGAGGCPKFNNVPNYGGFPYTPNKSPFTGEPMY